LSELTKELRGLGSAVQTFLRDSGCVQEVPNLDRGTLFETHYSFKHFSTAETICIYGGLGAMLGHELHQLTIIHMGFVTCDDGSVPPHRKVRSPWEGIRAICGTVSVDQSSHRDMHLLSL